MFWRKRESERADVDLPCGCRFSPLGRKAWRRQWWGFGCTEHSLWSDRPRFALEDPGEAGESVATIAVDQNADHTTVSVFGALDAVTSDDLVAVVSDVLEQVAASKVQVNLQGVTYMTSIGLEALEQIRDKARVRGCPCRISKVPSEVTQRWGGHGAIA